MLSFSCLTAIMFVHFCFCTPERHLSRLSTRKASIRSRPQNASVLLEHLALHLGLKYWPLNKRRSCWQTIGASSSISPDADANLSALMSQCEGYRLQRCVVPWIQIGMTSFADVLEQPTCSKSANGLRCPFPVFFWDACSASRALLHFANA